MTTFLVTGANGFVGRALCAALVKHGFGVRGAVRSQTSAISPVVPATVVGDLGAGTDWSAALEGAGVVIHLAARVHMMRESATDPLAEFRSINTAGTEHLARCAAASGVRRLVYVSSIKVNGESTLSPLPSGGATSHSTRLGNYPSQVAGYPASGGRERDAFTESGQPDPQDPYGISKWQAEQALHRIAQETGLEVVIVRPPLVYGPGVKGNFISLLAAIDKGIPLPLAGADNARSLVYVGNLVDALIACATHPAAVGQTYLVSDGDAVSTATLVDKIAQSLGRGNRSFYIPPNLLRAVAALLGRSEQVNRLFGSLRVNDEKIRSELGWVPPYTLEQGLRITADWYRSQHPG